MIRGLSHSLEEEQHIAHSFHISNRWCVWVMTHGTFDMASIQHGIVAPIDCIACTAQRPRYRKHQSNPSISGKKCILCPSERSNKSGIESAQSQAFREAPI